MPIQTFWCEETERVELSLRIYESGRACPANPAHGYCQTLRHLGLDPTPVPPRTYLRITTPDPLSAGSWPTACQHCGRVFVNPERQLWKDRVYRRIDTGETFAARSSRMPVGALWDAWFRKNRRGPDDIFLMCQTPGGEWGIDARASNCTRPEDQEHRCWCRRGDPRTGNVTVDKSGNTCSAGAGSIIVGDYHGFLTEGYLSDGFSPC